MRAPLHHADIGIHHVHELHVYGFYQLSARLLFAFRAV